MELILSLCLALSGWLALYNYHEASRATQLRALSIRQSIRYDCELPSRERLCKTNELVICHIDLRREGEWINFCQNAAVSVTTRHRRRWRVTCKQKITFFGAHRELKNELEFISH